MKFKNLVDEVLKESKEVGLDKETKNEILTEARGRKSIQLDLKEANSVLKGKKGSVVLADILQQLEAVSKNHEFKANNLKKIIEDYGLPVKTRNELIKWGWIEETGTKGKLRLTNKAVDVLTAKEFNLDKVKVKKVTKSVTKRMDLKTKKYKIPPSPKSSLTRKIVKEILSNMLAQLTGKIKTGILLAGNPGTGKTSTIRFIANLFGMNLVTIEAPHITEENVISIPYIIFDTKTGKEVANSMQLKQEGSEYKLIYAESNIVTQLKKLKPIREEQWEKIIRKSPLLKEYYEKFAVIIEQVRRNSEADKKGFSTILFLDEYYRRPSERIGNILRGILDGRIGSEKIPNDVYPIYATNLKDETGDVEQQMEHEEFIQVNFDDVTKDEFARFIADKYTPVDITTGEEKENPELTYEIDPDVYNEFLEILPEKLGQEPEKGLRMSPRRTEQVLVYLNSTVKNIQSVDDVRATLQYLKNLYTDYLTGETNPDYEKVKKLVVKFAKEKGIDVSSDIDEIPPTEWIKTFDLIMKAKEDADGELKITPIFASAPGQGKTSLVKQYAKDNKMGLIYINGYELSPDDVIGIPIPEEGKGKVTTKFTEPPLYKRIMDEYNELKNNESEYFQEGRKYNVILFIDEFSRVKNTKVFNALRMMMLEHKVTAEYPLPDDIIIVSAMNPNGVGTSPLSEHMKDVVNVIPTGLSFKKMMIYLQSNTDPEFEDTKLGNILRNIISQIAVELGSDTNTEGEPIDVEFTFYYWEVLPDTVVYVSPRILTTAYFQTLNDTKIELTLEGYDLQNLSFETEDEIKNVAQIILDTWKDSFLTALQNQIKDKNDLEDFDWEQVKVKLNTYFVDSLDEIVSTLAQIRSELAGSFSLSNILESKGIDALLDFGNDDLLVTSYGEYVKNATSVQEILEDFANVFQEISTKLDNKNKDDIIKLLKFINSVIKIVQDEISEGDSKLLKMTAKEQFKVFTNIENIELTDDNLNYILMLGQVYETEEYKEFVRLLGGEENE